MKDALWSLYVIRLPVNDYAAAYVGVTKQSPPRKRFSAHGHDKHPISVAIQACGKSNVIFEVLETGTQEYIVDRRETEMIQVFNTRWPSGYNIASGGRVCRDMLPQTRAKIGAASRSPERVSQLVRMAKSPAARARLASRNITDKAREASVRWGKSAENLARLAAVRESPRSKIARLMRGNSPENLVRLAAVRESQKFKTAQLAAAKSPENIARLRALAVGRVPWNKGVCGGRQSAETKAKISASLIGNKRRVGKAPWNKGMCEATQRMV